MLTDPVIPVTIDWLANRVVLEVLETFVASY